MESKQEQTNDSHHLDQAIQKYLEEKGGKKLTLSQIEKLAELDHGRKDPLFRLKRIHFFMPSFITLSVVVSFFYILLLVFKDTPVPEGLKILSEFLSSLPNGIWALLTTIFGFWFAGKAGSEIIDTWNKSKKRDP